MPDADPQIFVMAAAALPNEGESVACSAEGWNILVCRSGGEIFAVENRCTHRDQKLEGGRVRRGTIFCPHHGARFALSTGAACGPPASLALKTFSCREDANGLAIDMPGHQSISD